MKTFLFDDGARLLPIRAGVIPFFIPGSGGEPKYLLYKPMAVHKGLPPPAFQICKGARKLQEQGGVRRDAASEDFPSRVRDMEEPAAAALREGREEIGLDPDNILEWIDLGVAAYVSERSGKAKAMRLFACRVKDRDAFRAPHPGESNTAERRWVSAGQFAELARADHASILRRLDEALRVRPSGREDF